ncbi:MAG TPA: (d)CMP kinase [Acidimicrobiia bacterium]
MVVAIDGPGGVGKSTVTRALALDLGCEYLDTGATYRAATLAVLHAGVDPGDSAAVVACVAAARIEYLDGAVHLDGRPVAAQARSEAVTAAVSAVSAIPEVRAMIVAVQRAWVDERNGRAVVEGRDIGTVVFPDAALKVFLTARPDVRAARRASDAEAAGKEFDDVLADLERRDAFDAHREASPMVPAPDAVVIDTSDLSVAEVVGRIVRLLGDIDRESEESV